MRCVYTPQRGGPQRSVSPTPPVCGEPPFTTPPPQRGVYHHPPPLLGKKRTPLKKPQKVDTESGETGKKFLEVKAPNPD